MQEEHKKLLEEVAEKLKDKVLFPEALENAKNYLSSVKNLDILLDRKKYHEEGYIGEELLADRDEIKDKCIVVKQSIKDGDFTFEEALIAYGILKEDYFKYYPNETV